MRRSAILFLLAGLGNTESAAAQGLDWLFGAPSPAHRRVPHSSQRPKATTDVPMPVPRPRFLDDDAPPTESAKVAEPPATQVPDAGGPKAPATAPLPPERPADLQLAPTPPVGAPGTEDLEAGQHTPPPLQPSTPAPQGSPETAPSAPLPPQKPAQLAMPPAAPPVTPPAAIGTRAVAPSGATTAFNPREPAADAGCADRLAARGVVADATILPPQPDARCTVVQPMRLVSAKLEDGSTVSFPDKPTVACTTADAFSAYVHDLLAPLARGTWGVGLESVWTGPGLECRSRDHIFGAKLSAHGQGLAVDIAQLKLGDGRMVEVGEPKNEVEQHFETAARAGGCGYFHTVLGPGSDTYHRTHWHFDLEVRGREGDSKYCK